MQKGNRKKLTQLKYRFMFSPGANMWSNSKEFLYDLEAYFGDRFNITPIEGGDEFGMFIELPKNEAIEQSIKINTKLMHIKQKSQDAVAHNHKLEKMKADLTNLSKTPFYYGKDKEIKEKQSEYYSLLVKGVQTRRGKPLKRKQKGFSLNGGV